MNESHFADRFTYDVDDLLHECGQIDWEAAPADYADLLDLARLLATTDLSDESEIRQPLRSRLLSGLAQQKEIGRRSGAERAPRRLRFRAATLAAATLAVLVGLVMPRPRAFQVAADSIRAFVANRILGRSISVEQIDWATPVSLAESPSETWGASIQISGTPHGRLPQRLLPSPVPLPSPVLYPVVIETAGSWSIRTPIGSFGGQFVPNVQDRVLRLRRIEDARESVSFVLVRPRTLPPGYTLREAIVTPLDSVLLFYDGPGSDIILAQAPTGQLIEGSEGEDRRIIAFVREVRVLTDRPIESVLLRGQPAGWIEGHGLMWESGGMSYTLGGSRLDLEEALRIAESLEHLALEN